MAGRMGGGESRLATVNRNRKVLNKKTYVERGEGGEHNKNRKKSRKKKNIFSLNEVE